MQGHPHKSPLILTMMAFRCNLHIGKEKKSFYRSPFDDAGSSLADAFLAVSGSCPWKFILSDTVKKASVEAHSMKLVLR
jgi:hypothetical protein